MPRRIAVIGGGVSGLGAAYELGKDHHVVLFEAGASLGGHARTVLAGRNGDQPVDTGFIVFNKVNYPHLTALFEALEVPIAPSSMSFGASIDGGRIEYGLSGFAGVFAQRRNLVRPAYLRMIRDIFRFNARAEAAVRDGMTIADLLRAVGTGEWFRDYYLLPFSGAIWSTPARDILNFPAQALVSFFRNHALLDHAHDHQWYTVRGGSREYVSRLAGRLGQRGVEIHTDARVTAVRRTGLGAQVKLAGGDWSGFDEVVFATHSDDTLRLLSDATGVERTALSAIRYQPNEAVLHADPSLMPKRRICWSSWVYSETRGQRPDRIGLTYWMNSLQPIPMDDPLFVSLNPQRPIRDDLIHDVTTFRHPVFTREALQAQGVLRAMNGANSTWFCGAWMKNGFHEDGWSSALDVARDLAASRAAPYAVAAE